MKKVETMIVRTLVPLTDKNGTNLRELIWLQRDFADQSVQSPIYCCNLFLRERTTKVQLRQIKHIFLIDIIAKLTLINEKVNMSRYFPHDLFGTVGQIDRGCSIRVQGGKTQ